ncbi:unnamed protein product [Ranitomeya imitator]|uniref:Flavin-containing monooxygenase n=1 Tax=Ranitomeya imitator TaxID=111125 RepID=A0ABN9M443_9NEOB|nr:unnamed protein product [Ranitomeya imitator]
MSRPRFGYKRTRNLGDLLVNNRLSSTGNNWLTRSQPTVQAAGSGAMDAMREGSAMTSWSCDRDVITGPALKPTLGPEAAACIAHRCQDYKGPSEGLVQLPDKVTMTQDIVMKKYIMSNRYVDSQRHTIQVDYMEYMDELATLAGVKPSVFKLLLTDPRLALHVLFGPCTPYQYRLSGPGKWSGAREAILTQMNRVIKPTETRVLENTTMDRSIPLMLKVFALFIVVVAFFLYQ